MITTKIENITPEWACRELDKHEDELARGEYNQRPFSEGTAQGYAVAMQNDHWLVNGQGLMYDDKGRLRDGRHRLWAVVMSGKTVQMLVTRGCTDRQIGDTIIHAVDTVDVGRVRTVAQQLSIDGVKMAANVSAACRAIARVCTGFPNARMTVIQVRQIHEMFSIQLEHVMEGLHRSGRLMTGYMLGPLCLYRNFKSGNADQFCWDYFTMENLPAGSPVIALQKYLLNNIVSGSSRADHATRAVALALKHYDAGIKINALRFSAIGAEWLIEHNRPVVAKIRTILGMNFKDHRSP